MSSQAINTAPPSERILRTNEQVTGPPAAELLRRSGIVQYAEAPLRVLDNATGGGVLIEELFQLLNQSSPMPEIKKVIAGDIDENMLEFVRERKAQNTRQDPSKSLWSHVEVHKVNQQSIPFPNHSFTHIFSNFGIFFCPDSDAALREAHNALFPGGTLALSSWKSIAWWSAIAEPAFATHIPEAPVLLSPNQLFPGRGWSDPEVVRTMLENAGFMDVQVDEFAFTPNVQPKEFAAAMAVLVSVAAKRSWSEEQFAQFQGRIAPALEKYMFDTFPEGRWDGKMVAILSIGKRG